MAAGAADGADGAADVARAAPLGWRARALRRLMLLADGLGTGRAAGARKAMLRRLYGRMSAWDSQAVMTCMNYGYAPPGDGPADAAPPFDGPEGHCLRLYARVAGAVDLRGRAVLEVGCGRGGGAAFVHRHLGPRSVVGLDLAPPAVAFCARRHAAAGLAFRVGDAEALPFPDAAFDAVVNVESSHCYPDLGRFLAEARRVLRPGGALLLADLRLAEHAPALLGAIARAGLALAEAEEITPHVARALVLDSGRRLALMRRHTPRPLHGLLREFVGAEGSAMHELLRAGAVQYWRVVARAG